MLSSSDCALNRDESDENIEKKKSCARRTRVCSTELSLSLLLKSQVVVKRITFCGRNGVFPPFFFVSFIVSLHSIFFVFMFLSSMRLLLLSIVLFELLHIVVVSAWRLCDLCRSCRFSSSLKFKVNPYQCKNYSLVIIATEKWVRAAQTRDTRMGEFHKSMDVLEGDAVALEGGAPRWLIQCARNASGCRCFGDDIQHSIYPRISKNKFVCESSVSLRRGFIYGMCLQFSLASLNGLTSRAHRTKICAEWKKNLQIAHFISSAAFSDFRWWMKESIGIECLCFSPLNAIGAAIIKNAFRSRALTKNHFTKRNTTS